MKFNHALMLLLCVEVFACGQVKNMGTMRSLESTAVQTPKPQAENVAPASSRIEEVSSEALPATETRNELGLFDDRCIERAMQKLKMRASGDTVVVTGRLHLEACLRGSTGASQADLPVLEPEDIHFTVTCQGTDLSALDGKEFGDLTTYGQHPCATAAEGQLGQLGDEVALRIIRGASEPQARE